MRSRAFILVIGLSITALLFVGCETSTGPSGDEGDIRNGIGEGGEYYAYFYPSDFGVGGQGSPPGMLGGPEDEATPPVGWFRAFTYGAPEVWVHFPDPMNAEVLVHYYFTGTMYVDRIHDGIWNPGSKEFALTFIKEGRFVKQNDEWVLTHITPGEFRLTEGDQTVEIETVKIESTNFNRTYADPTEMIPLEDLPHFQPGDEVTVTVTATNESDDWTPECFAYIHHDKERDPMTYDGETETYIKTYTIGNEERVHHGCADVLDAQTLMTESGDDYNGSAWAIPYYVGNVPTI
jgi:hypothetical protein